MFTMAVLLFSHKKYIVQPLRYLYVRAVFLVPLFTITSFQVVFEDVVRNPKHDIHLTLHMGLTIQHN